MGTPNCSSCTILLPKWSIVAIGFSIKIEPYSVLENMFHTPMSQKYQSKYDGVGWGNTAHQNRLRLFHDARKILYNMAYT